MPDSPDQTPPDEFAEIEPPRRRKRRNPIIGLVVVGFAAWLLATVREQSAYFFRGGEPLVVGEADRATASRLLLNNTFVRVQGTPDRKRAIVIEGRWGGFKGLFPLFRTGGHLWVAQPRKGRQPPGVLTDVFEGRVVRLRTQSFFAQVFRYYAEKMTATFDLDPLEVVRAAGRVPARVHARHGEDVDLDGRRDLFVQVAFPDQYRLQFDRAKYGGKEECERIVAGLGLPWAALPESRAFRSYLVIAAAEAAPRLIERFRDVSQKVGVVPRAETIAAKWADVAAQGDALVLRALAGGAPEEWVVTEDKLASAPVATPLTLPRERVLSVEVTAPYRIPMNAFVLLEGDTPGSYWWFFAMDLVLGAVILGNLASLALRLRRPKTA